MGEKLRSEKKLEFKWVRDLHCSCLFCLRTHRRTQLCSILIIEKCITNYKKYLVVDIELFFPTLLVYSRWNFCCCCLSSTENHHDIGAGWQFKHFFLFHFISKWFALLTQTKNSHKWDQRRRKIQRKNCQLMDFLLKLKKNWERTANSRMSLTFKYYFFVSYFRWVMMGLIVSDVGNFWGFYAMVYCNGR